MGTIVIPTPEWDAKLYNNSTKSNDPRSACQLHEDAKRMVDNEIAAALDKAAQHELSILSGRFDLSPYRSDEVEALVALLEKLVTRSIKKTAGFIAPVFTFYEKKTPTYVVDDVRDLTFNAPHKK